MRKLLIVVLLLAVLVHVTGCGGVVLNAEYGVLLDQTAALSAETARRADAGELSPDEMRVALRHQAGIWQKFRDARDGLSGEGKR